MESPPSLPDTVYQLWDELDQFKPHEMEAANRHLIKTIGDWLEADYSYWVGGVRVADGELADDDLMNGWRARVVESHRFPPDLGDHFEHLMENQELAETVGSATMAITREAGDFRVRSLRELVDLSRFEETEYFQKYQMPYGLSDRLYVVTPINPDAESYYCFVLAGADRRFSPEDAGLAGAALRGIRWFQRRVFLSHGLLVGDDVLTPIEREIVLLLLTEKSEKEIAAQIGKAHSTTHNYITGIFRKFAVNGRAGLMAVWLG